MLNYESIGKGVYREINCLIQADSTNIIDDAEFPKLSNEYLKEKFKFCTKFAISLKNQLLAVITPSRDLELYGLKDDSALPKCRLRVLHDPHPEYCLLEWSNSQNLLLLTRSTGVVDVFESTGVYCYSLQVGDDKFDVKRIISQIITTASTEPDIYDIAYIMQFNSKFSVYKLGKGNMFELLFSYKLNLPKIYCMTYLPMKGFLIVSTEYLVDKPINQETKFTDIGLALFEYRQTYIQKKMLPMQKSKWFSIFNETHGVVISLDANLETEEIIAVTNHGDIILFNAYLEIQKYINGDKLIYESRFIQAIFTDTSEIVVLHKNGLIIQENVNSFFDDYLSGNLQGTMIENCEKVYPSIKYEVFALSEKESSYDVVVSTNDYVNRFWFFTLFRLTFLYEWIKVLSGAIVGQPMQDVRTNYERSYKFFIYKIKTITLLQYIKKLLTKRDYIEAEKLADTDEEFDKDIIYKQRWTDAGSDIDKTLVDELNKVKDKKWVVQECLKCDSHDVEVQRRLLDLADVAVIEIGSNKLNERVQNARLIFDSLKNHPEMFLKYRSMFVLEAALNFAEEANVDILVDFALKHSDKLQSYIVMILTLIPEVISVQKYEDIIPWKKNGENRKFVLDVDAFIDNEIIPNKYVEERLNQYIFTNNTGDNVDFFVSWCRKRIAFMDENSGLLNNVANFIQILIDHEFDELRDDLKRFNLYKEFVVLTSTVALTFDKFVEKEPVFIRDSIIKHMKQTDVLEHMVKIVELFEEFYPKEAADEILLVAKHYSVNDFEILLRLYSIRPKYISKDLLTACFMKCKLIGPPLICTLKKFDFELQIIKALQLCVDYGYEPQFSHLYEARISDELAGSVYLNFLKSAFSDSEINYISVLDTMKQLKNLLFDELLEDKNLIKIFASELLSKLSKERFMGFPFSLVIDLSSKNMKKLNSNEWQELLLIKSNEFMDKAMPNKNDFNLILAREVLTLTGRQQMKEDLKKQSNLIDIIELSIELGSQRLPSTFKFIDSEILLQEIVSTNNNYRQVKKCGELSKLLKLKQPVAKAMAYCTAEALKADDILTVEKYIHKLSETCRNMPVVFNICLEIISSNKWKTSNNDLITCMIINCPSEKMYMLSEYLKDQKFVGDNRSNMKETEDKEMKSNTFQKLKQNLDNFVDPLFEKNEPPSLIEDDDLHLDPFYCDNRFSHQISKYPNYVPQMNDKEITNPKVWSSISSTIAIVMATIQAESGSWTTNDILNKASIGLKKIIESSSEDIPLNVLEYLSTELLIKISGDLEEVEIKTPLDRILCHGCDRERFFDDSSYRQDSLLGLVMTKDESMINDITEVAKQFGMSLWNIYFAFVEYLLTENEVTPNEAKSFIKNYSLREELWCDMNQLYDLMRSSVFPLLPENDVNKLKLYLTFFKQPEAEFYFFKCLPSIIGVNSSINMKQILSGHEGVVLGWMMSLLENPDFDDDFAGVVRFFKSLKNFEQIINKLTSFLKISPGITPNRRIRLLFILLEKKADLLIDQISNEMSLSEEKSFWNEVLNLWETTSDKYEERLLLKIRHRLQRIKTSEVNIPIAKEQEQMDSMMRRRQK